MQVGFPAHRREIPEYLKLRQVRGVPQYLFCNRLVVREGCGTSLVQVPTTAAGTVLAPITGRGSSCRLALNLSCAMVKLQLPLLQLSFDTVVRASQWFWGPIGNHFKQYHLGARACQVLPTNGE